MPMPMMEILHESPLVHQPRQLIRPGQLRETAHLIIMHEGYANICDNSLSER